MEDIRKTVGKMIHDARKRKGLTQEELAALIDSSNGHISEIERGLVDAGVSILTRICCSLDISLNELVQGQRLSNRIPMGMNEKIKGLTDEQIELLSILIDGMIEQNNRKL